MANGKFYHVYLVPRSGIDLESVENKMNLALDWFKYSRTNWVVYSNASMEKLMTRYKSLVEPGGRLFICEINTKNRNGWMEKDFWEWLKQERYD